MNHNIKFILAIPVMFLFWDLPAQNLPAPPQSAPMLFTGVSAHLGNGEVIKSAYVAFDQGKFTYVGDQKGWTGKSNYQIINAEGQHLYPGFIAPNTNLGLVEIGAVRATRDFREVGLINPNVRTLIAYDTDSEVLPTVRANGILLAQTAPQGQGIAGSSSIVQLDAWNWEDAAVKADDGIHLYWPRSMRFSFRTFSLEKNEQYREQIDAIKSYMEQAAAYVKKTEVQKKNLKFEAMRALLEGAANLYIHVNDVKAIQEAVLAARKYELPVVIVGGRDSWMITDFLKEHQVAVILGETHSLPGRTDADVDEPFKTPAILEEAGVLYCFSGNGNWQQFNLPFQAGQAVGYGLDPEAAVKALTSNTAQILGIGDQTGRLAEGLDATFFLSEGDALDMRTNQLTQAFINGREIDLDNRHKKLYRKFREKYSR